MQLASALHNMQWGRTMKNENLLGPWIRRFLLEHLVAERNLSRNTQASYRDTLKLLLPFASRQGGCAIDRMAVEELTPAIARKFLDHLERDRRCSEATRNQRLATIHSLAHYIGMRSPVHLAWCSEIRAIPFKKTTKAVIGYLEKVEMDVLLDQPDRRTSLGVRDHALLLFLYNSGARADEIGHGCDMFAGLLIGLVHRPAAGDEGGEAAGFQPLDRAGDKIIMEGESETAGRIVGTYGAITERRNMFCRTYSALCCGQIYVSAKGMSQGSR